MDKFSIVLLTSIATSGCGLFDTEALDPSAIKDKALEQAEHYIDACVDVAENSLAEREERCNNNALCKYCAEGAYYTEVMSCASSRTFDSEKLFNSCRTLKPAEKQISGPKLGVVEGDDKTDAE